MLPSTLAFAIWIAFGVWRARNAKSLRDRALAVPRGRRLATGIGALLLSLPAAFVPMMVAMAERKFFESEGKPSLFAWVYFIFVGLVFIDLQIKGVTYLAATALEDRVTERRGETSGKEGSPE